MFSHHFTVLETTFGILVVLDLPCDLRDVRACFNTCFAQKFTPRSADKRGRSCGVAGRAVPLYSRRDFSILFAVNIPRPRPCPRSSVPGDSNSFLPFRRAVSGMSPSDRYRASLLREPCLCFVVSPVCVPWSPDDGKISFPRAPIIAGDCNICNWSSTNVSRCEHFNSVIP